ncbi:hypothetical protein [Streptomyces sp. CLI2509]|uniref:hypothetical protein n=1 Tax=Streptomyces sp. CLI2509 TaxID=1984801 RepID=UPI00193AA4E4|nr:hypothetical protein [Streptomyces sp. CLI2509]
MAVVAAAIGVVPVLVILNALVSGTVVERFDDGPEPVPADAEPDGEPDGDADGEAGAAPGAVSPPREVPLGLVPLSARSVGRGSVSPAAPKTATAATLTADTPAATPSGTIHLRCDEAALSPGSVIFISSSSRIRRWFGRSRSGGAGGMPCMSFIVRPPSSGRRAWS